MNEAASWTAEQPHPANPRGPGQGNAPSPGAYCWGHRGTRCRGIQGLVPHAEVNEFANW